MEDSQRAITTVALVQEHQKADHDNLAAFSLSFVCRNHKVLSAISHMRHARFN